MTGDTPGKAEFRAAACQGKEPYRTAALAMKVLRRRQRNGGDHKTLQAYRCKLCGNYHIGAAMRKVHEHAYRNGKHRGPSKGIR